ncbi:hypothetical protein BDN72DRAFT_494748 [Pluteus cervinus]|uniref:Uncharacterized protein n=1 Tax=Pluteus cervinus TaxID=181527 RepID=A0ACD3A5C2_9AGAR|nr:hypothetical protein BDN72DRAFT_494748 [Pluteus cervinus]
MARIARWERNGYPESTNGQLTLQHVRAPQRWGGKRCREPFSPPAFLCEGVAVGSSAVSVILSDYPRSAYNNSGLPLVPSCKEIGKNLTQRL